MGSIGFPWGVKAFQSFVNRIYKKIYLTWPVNAKNMCAKFGVDRRFPWGVTAFQSFVNRIYEKIYLTWPVNAKNMCAKFGVDRRFPWGVTAFQSFADFGHSNAYSGTIPGATVTKRTCLEPGGHGLSRQRETETLVPLNQIYQKISDLASRRQEHVCQVWGRSEVSLRSYSVSKFRKSNLQQNIWPGQSMPRTCVPSLGSIGFPWGVTNNISDLASQRQEHVRQVWGRSGFPEELQRFKVS